MLAFCALYLVPSKKLLQAELVGVIVMQSFESQHKLPQESLCCNSLEDGSDKWIPDANSVHYFASSYLHF